MFFVVNVLTNDRAVVARGLLFEKRISGQVERYELCVIRRPYDIRPCVMLPTIVFFMVNVLKSDRTVFAADCCLRCNFLDKSSTASCVSTDTRTTVVRGSRQPNFASFVVNSVTSDRTVVARVLKFEERYSEHVQRYKLCVN